MFPRLLRTAAVTLKEASEDLVSTLDLLLHSGQVKFSMRHSPVSGREQSSEMEQLEASASAASGGYCIASNTTSLLPVDNVALFGQFLTQL